MSHEDMLIATRTRVASERAAQLDHASMMDLLAERVPDTSIFEDREPFFALVVASNDRVDSYGTRMDRSTLKNFAENAADGVAVMDSHRTGGFFSSPSLNFGRSLTGEVKKEGEDTNFRSVFYTIPGLTVDGRSTTDYVDGIRAGIFADISVGFSLGPEARIQCSICGNDMMDWEECGHFPGVAYEEKGKGRQIAIGTIMNATLREYSLVYEGATPGAGVVKATRMIEEGLMDDGRLADVEIPRLERIYGRHFELPKRVHAIGSGTPEKEPAMAKEGDGNPEENEFRTKYEDLERAVGSALKSAGLRSTGSAEDNIELIVERVAELRADIDERDATIKELRSDAEDGRAFRDRLVEATVKATARATPESRKDRFDEKRVEKRLQRYTVEELYEEYETQKALGDELFASGRQSREHAEDSTVPDVFAMPLEAHEG